MGIAVKTKGSKIYIKLIPSKATHFVIVTHPQSTFKVTSKSNTQLSFQNCVYLCLNSEKTIMPCSPLCRLNLAIVQNRYIRLWIMSTINLLENSAGLYQFTLELPWPGFTPENITYLIRQFSNYHAAVNSRIQSLTRISASGCHICRSHQHQARSPQY